MFVTATYSINTVRHGRQRRDADAAGKEQLGRFAARRLFPSRQCTFGEFEPLAESFAAGAPLPKCRTSAAAAVVVLFVVLFVALRRRDASPAQRAVAAAATSSLFTFSSSVDWCHTHTFPADPTFSDEPHRELELELIQTHMTQKPMLRIEVGE
jgi:hypothetical protein